MAQSLFPNLATDADVRDRLEREFLPQLPKVRNDRKPLEQAWLRYYRIWAADRDQQAYQGRSRTYIPVGRRVIENWVQKLKRDLFASDDWFDVHALRASQEQRADGIKTLFRYFLDKHIHLRRKMTPFLRQLVTYGTAPVAVAWRYDERILPVLKDIEDNDGNITGRVERVIENVVQYVGPTFRNVDLFAWYLAPVTVADVEDANLVFEEMLVARAKLKLLGNAPIGDDPGLGNVFENVTEALDMNANPEVSDKFQSEQQRLQSKGFSARIDTRDPNRAVDITEAYWKVNLDDTRPDWWRITVAGDRVPLRVQKNPFWTGKPPWLAAKFTEVVNEFYGRGLPETFDRIQYLLNDVADQSNDALVWCLNPIAIVNPYEVQDPSSIRMRPGAKWMANPDAIKFAEPPTDIPAVGFGAVQQFMGLISDISNATAFAGTGKASYQSRGRALSTATGASIVQNESLVQVRDIVETVEDMVLEPFLQRMHVLTMQCLNRPIILRIAGADGASVVEHKLSAADVVGDYDFGWLGSTHTQNQQVRSQQMINFLQIATRVPPQLLAAQNTIIDYGYLMKAIWKDGLGLRDAERVIKPIQQTHSMDPRIENDLFKVGRGDEVEVAQADNDDLHLKVHNDALDDPALDGFGRAQLAAHMQKHVASKIAKQMLAQQQQLQQQTQQMGLPGPSGQGAPQQNPGRLDQTSNAADVMRSMPRDMTNNGGY